MSRLTRDGMAEPVSRDQILRHARGQGNIHFSCSADHEQDWQPYPVDPYSAICDDHTYTHAICNLINTHTQNTYKSNNIASVLVYLHGNYRYASVQFNGRFLRYIVLYCIILLTLCPTKRFSPYSLEPMFLPKRFEIFPKGSF